MKSFLKYFLVYLIGVFFVFSVIFKYDSINKDRVVNNYKDNMNSYAINK